MVIALLPCIFYCKEFSYTEVHASFWIGALSFLDIYPGVKLLDNMVTLFVVFWEMSILFSPLAAQIYIATNSV